MEDHLKCWNLMEIAEQISILNLIMKQFHIGLQNRSQHKLFHRHAYIPGFLKTTLCDWKDHCGFWEKLLIVLRNAKVCVPQNRSSQIYKLCKIM